MGLGEVPLDLAHPARAVESFRIAVYEQQVARIEVGGRADSRGKSRGWAPQVAQLGPPAKKEPARVLLENPVQDGQQHQVR
jgi:hypothetical protein